MEFPPSREKLKYEVLIHLILKDRDSRVMKALVLKSNVFRRCDFDPADSTCEEL